MERCTVSEGEDSTVKIMFLPNSTHEFNATQIKFQGIGFR